MDKVQCSALLEEELPSSRDQKKNLLLLDLSVSPQVKFPPLPDIAPLVPVYVIASYLPEQQRDVVAGVCVRGVDAERDLEVPLGLAAVRQHRRQVVVRQRVERPQTAGRNKCLG